MEKLKYLVYMEVKNGADQLKAGFADKLDAWNYKDMITSINRMAGYKDRYYLVDTTEKGVKKNDEEILF